MSPDPNSDTDPHNEEADAESDSAFEDVVRTAVDEVLADPMRSDVVGVAKLAEFDRVRDAAGVSEEALRTAIGTVLSEADYAEKVARNKYRIHDDGRSSDGQ